ncbi:MAG TPA: PH domain-containing protein [Planctomycetaceae bacterium]|nr:PH domain-containing protein [Planctomycetaceae bacterium]
MSMKPQAISGVSAQHENVIMVVYPSVAQTALGRLLGQLYESWAAAAVVGAGLLVLGAALALRANASESGEAAIAWAVLAVLGAGLLATSVLKRTLNGIKPSHLLFPLPASPVAALVYLFQKTGGRRYVLTNRHVAVWTMLLGVQRMLRAQVPLAQIADIEVDQQPGQEFYRAADLVVLDAAGNRLVRLEAVPRADVFRQIILEARDARRHVEHSLARIEARARQPA